MKLYIGNKNYSSWSFRPWIAMVMKGIEFEEILVPFDMPAGNPTFKDFSPNAKVPALHDGDLKISESLAILEYLADKHPDLGFWPEALQDRAMARAYANEMHAGFAGLRNECPMNMRRPVAALEVSDATRRDVSRIEQIWETCLQQSGGPFLFGDFCNVDAMFAPVVNRLEIYALSQRGVVRDYTHAMKSTEAWQQWEAAGIEEPWVVEEDEA